MADEGGKNQDIMKQTLDNFSETPLENELNAKVMVDNAGSMPSEVVEQLRRELWIAEEPNKVSVEEKPHTNLEMENMIAAVESAHSKSVDKAGSESKSNTPKMRLDDFFADTKKPMEIVKPRLVMRSARETIVPAVSEEEFVDYVEDLVEKHGKAKRIPDEGIGIDPRFVNITEDCLLSIRESYRSQKMLWFETNETVMYETAGWMFLTSVANKGSAAQGFLISDFDIEEVGDFGMVMASDNVRNPGYIDMHTHLADDYFLRIDMGDLDSALVQHNFVENGHGEQISNERIFAIASLTPNRKEMHIRLYSHKMSDVEPVGDGYSLGLKRFSNDVVIDLR